MDGKIVRNAKVRIVIRDGVVVHTGELDYALKRFQSDVKEVSSRI